MDTINKQEHRAEIVQYYHRTEWVYRQFWNLDESLGIHFGFWEPGVNNLTEAIIRQNEEMAKMINIIASDHVLDAGCGVGGSSIWLATNIGCMVTGITITPKQVVLANKNAQHAGVTDKTAFYEMDYRHTSFNNEQFDVIWATESVCHAPDKAEFFKEAARLLKPGGRIIIADYFQTKKPLSVKEDKALFKNGFNGWSIYTICEADQFKAACHEFGFEQLTFTQVNDKVMPSFKNLLRKLYFWLVPGWIYHKLGGITATEFNNAYGSYYISKTLGKLWDYYVFTAVKKK